MSSAWEEFDLGECCEILSSKRIFAKDYVEEGIPFYRSKEIIEKALGQFSGDELFITQKRFDEIKLKFGAPKKGDLLISAVGNRSGIPYCVKEDYDFYFKDGNLIWFRNFKKELDPKFLENLLNSPSGQKRIESMMIGSAQKALTIAGVKKIKVNLPPLSEQKAIAHILGTLDDKIELNRQINQTLEAMAQALFKSWFVDFDPVIDNALAAGNQIPEALQARAEKRKALLDRHSALDAESPQKGAPLFYSNPALAVLFPSSFEYNETLDKWIPEGWEVKGLGEIAHFGNGKTSPERFNDGIYPVYGSNGEIGRTNESNRENIIIIGRVGTYCGSLYYFSGKAWITDNAMFAQAKEISNNLFLFELLKRCNLNDMSTGSGQPLLNQGILKSIDTISPPDEILKHFNRQLSALEFKRTANVEQAETLTQLRDTLLPQLISGKVRVPASMLSGD